MRFTAGLWRMREGATGHYPANVHEVEVEPDALTIYGPTRPVHHRADTLNTPSLTVRFSSPMANVVRVQIVHHKGTLPEKPEFELNTQPGTKVEIYDGPEAATLTSGSLTVRVEKQGEWRIDFKDGERTITHSGLKDAGFVDFDESCQERGRYVHERLALDVGECVYGLGERFTAFVKNGQTIETWNDEGGTNSQLTYKCIPFYMTNRGYGVLVNHPERVSFEVATERVEHVQFSVPGEYLEYFLINGPSPKEVLERYTALTGRPALPPAWSFGLWLTTSFTTDYDEKTVTGVIEGMAERDLPLHVFHFDCFWMKEFRWCDFEWDDRQFPDPAGMLKRLKKRGLHICVWINPYIGQRSKLFDEGMAGGYLLKRPSGDVWQWDLWQAGMGIVDFTNPEARRWYGDELRALAGMGVDCFKTDFGERIPTDVVYHDGSDPFRMHNYYTYLYNRTAFEALEETVGKGEAVLFARSATVGCQKYPVHWGGDCGSTFGGMAQSLRGGLSLGLSGFGFWSHDIGGFAGTPPTDLYKRWVAFGLLSSHSRLHGDTSHRVPWVFDDEAVDVLRSFTKLKCRLMPYLYAQALEARDTGIPVMRAMMLEFPTDPACDHLDRQYMLGDSLLVAPVFSEDGVVSYYLPEGRWTRLLNGEVVEGPGWKRETHGFLSLPLLVRPGSLIAFGAEDSRPDYEYGEGVTLRLYELADGECASAAIPSVSGGVVATFEARREGSEIALEWDGGVKRWQLLLVGIDSVVSVEGATAESTGDGVLLTPSRGARRLRIDLGREA